MHYCIRAGTPADVSQIEPLMPRLADFEVPAHRVAEHLWHGDRELILSWANGDRPDVDVTVAVSDERLVGVAAITARNELLSGDPSAHLELLAVAPGAEGHGIGSALMQAIEQAARLRGARSISLHVFSVNQRARALYERHGFDGELMRYFKPLD